MKCFRGQLMVWCNASVPCGRSWARPLEAGLILMLAAFFSNAETIRLRPVADTSMHELAPIFNMGGHTHAASGTTERQTKSRALFRFDLEGQIPPGATINSVSVVLTVTGTPSGGGAPSTFGLHRVLNEWVEGDKTGNTGSPAGAGETTWTARMNPTTLWGAPGGAAAADFVSDASASALVSSRGEYTFGPSAGLLGDVEFWKGSGDSNFGWILVSEAEDTRMTARRFGSRESGNSAAALVIEFTAPFVAEPPGISEHPQSQTVSAGSLVTLGLVAIGSEPLTYQWQFNGVDIAGATEASFVLENVQPVSGGTYRVRVMNAAGSVTSADAALIVQALPVEPPRIESVNLEGETLTLVFATPPNLRIAVEFTDTLGSGVWTSLEAIEPGAESVVVRATDSVSGARQRFYRLRIVEP